MNKKLIMQSIAPILRRLKGQGKQTDQDDEYSNGWDEAVETSYAAILHYLKI